MPLFWCALFLAAGIVLSYFLPVSLWVWVCLSLAAIGLIILVETKKFQFGFIQRSYLFFKVGLPVLLLIFCLGGLKQSLSQPVFTQNDLAWYNDRGTYTLTAVVSQPPDRRENAEYLTLSMRELYDPLTSEYRRIRGTALMRVGAAASWQLGDELRFNASPQTPSESEDFSYRDYLERQGIYTVIYYPTSVSRVGSGQANFFYSGLDWLRQRASKTIFSILPQPESGLLAGILLGNDNDLPEKTSLAYRDTGTAHIIAISGFNISILAALFMFLFSRFFNRNWTLAATTLLLAVYTLFVGASPSVVRAAVMAVLAFYGRLLGRKGSGLNALGAAAGAMLILNPLQIFDASFQLSFAATFGLVSFADPMQSWLERQLARHVSEEASHQLNGPVSEYFLFTLAAQLTTLPVVALQFKRLSLVSFLANPLVLPVQPAILILGLAAAAAGMVFFPLGKLIGVLTWPLLAYSNRMVEWLDQMPAAAVAINGNAAVVLCAALILIVLGLLMRKTLYKLFTRIPLVFWISLLAILCTLIWTAAARVPDGRLHVSLIRSEAGSSVFLRGPGGQTILIDPAGSPNTLASAVSGQLSPWDFHVDAILLTNRASATAVPALNDRLPVKSAVLAPLAYQLTDGQSPISLPRGIAVNKLGDGENILLDKSVKLQIIAFEGQSSALLITFGNTRILIPGGVSPAQIRVQSPESFDGLAALILKQEDAANLPADMWNQYRAGVVLWNDSAAAPDANWQGLDACSRINLDAQKQSFQVSTETE